MTGVVLMSALCVLLGLGLVQFGAGRWADAPRYRAYAFSAAWRLRAVAGGVLAAGLGLVALGALDLVPLAIRLVGVAHAG